ncbi:MAG: hypothetical protein IT366_09440 [Candidatus Hydrogenedentes bacterium]|nr:hypothetical protein [Candidatus Hydrogenedentota bacterium]
MALCIVGAFAITFVQSRTKPWRQAILTGVACLLAIVGAVGFFGAAISATGGLNWLPPTFEWPMGRASGVITLDNGMHAVPHAPTGRLQIYSADWRFIRGWRVDASGGVFRLRPGAGNQIEVYTARGDNRLVYAVEGNLLSKEAFGSYPPDIGAIAYVPTRPWLWVFTSPFYSWLFVAVGLIILIFFDRGGKSKAGVNSTDIP